MHGSRCFKFDNCDIFESDGSISYGRNVFVRDGRFDSPSATFDEVVDYSKDFAGLSLFPSAIDCQVNGSEGILFEDIVQESQLLTLDASLATRGTTRWCGTFVSSPCDKIERVLKVVKGCTQPTGLIGIHFEGPWLNPKYRGCHPAARLAPSSPRHVDLIAHAMSIGKVIVTIAPEVITEADLTRIVGTPGILLCVGHSDAGPDLIDEKVGGRLHGLTHAFNCMPSVTARAPGPLGMMMRTSRCWSSVICDGEHVCRETFHMLKRSSCRGKIFLVSDQMPVDAAVKGVLPFATEGIVFDGNALRSKEGRLAGSARSLVDCMRVAISRFSVPADEAIRMGTEYPARFLGVVEQYGMIDLGRYADFIIADNQLNIHAVFRNGMRLV